MKVGRQTTLRDQAVLSGIGVHSGLPVTLTLHPAEADTGIRFIRTGIEQSRDREIRADMGAVTATEFATVLGDASGPLVSTAEHVLAALRGLGVDNAVVEIDGPEAPIMDGSAAPFVAAIDQVGLETLDVRGAISGCSSRSGSRWATPSARFGPMRAASASKRDRVRPSADRPPIVRRSTSNRTRSGARSRARVPSVSCATWRSCGARGYALGASLENTLVVTENRVLNPEGTRFPDEFVRHKILDAIGDLALAGAPLLGAYRSVRGGHKLNHAVLVCADGGYQRLDAGRRRGAAAGARPCRGRRSAGWLPVFRAGRFLSAQADPLRQAFETWTVRHIPGGMSA